MIEMVDVHGRLDGAAVDADAFFENEGHLIVGVGGEAGELGRVFRPIAHRVDGLNPDGTALEMRGAVGDAVVADGIVAFPAASDFLFDVAAAVDVGGRGGAGLGLFGGRFGRVLARGRRGGEHNGGAEDDERSENGKLAIISKSKMHLLRLHLL